MSENSTVSNLGLAAFLLMKKYKLKQTPTRESDGKFSFVFNINKEELEKISYEYYCSEFSLYDVMLVKLKKMLPRY